MKFSHSWPVTTEGSDSSGRMSLPYLCNLLQETATLHADRLGWSYDTLAREGLQWVLSRQWIQMFRYPRWKEQVTVETWPSGKGAITWNRDFRLTDAEGNLFGIATSLWFVMDRETRRPKPAKVGPDMDVEGADRVRKTELKPLPALTEPAIKRKIVAGYHDIDVHDHVNNLRYLTWMLDGMDAEYLQKHEAREVEINFMMEGFLGDELEICTDTTAPETNQKLQNLRRKNDNVELSRMLSTWEPVR